MIISPNQSLSVCPEDADVLDAICDPKNPKQCDNKVFPLGHGIQYNDIWFDIHFNRIFLRCFYR